MKQITEDYCSFEVAKLLKEKGFDEKTLSYYQDNVICHGDWFEWNRSPFGHIAAPTHQMAIAWILEKYNVYIEATALKHNYWVYTIYKIFDNKVEELYNEGSFKSHEKAVEAALKYALENLI